MMFTSSIPKKADGGGEGKEEKKDGVKDAPKPDESLRKASPATEKQKKTKSAKGKSQGDKRAPPSPVSIPAAMAIPQCLCLFSVGGFV